LDKNVKSQRILTKLCAQDSEYIDEKTPNFVEKYSLTVELLIFKHRRQNISVSVTLVSAVTGPEVTFADRTMLLHIGRVNNFIAPTLVFQGAGPWQTD